MFIRFLMYTLLYKEENWHKYSLLVLTVQISFLANFILLNIIRIFFIQS